MTEHRSGKPYSGCVGCGAAGLACLLILGVLVSTKRESVRQELEARQIERCEETLAEVRAGDGEVTRYDTRLIPLLADDPDCFCQVSSIYFFMSGITAEEAERIGEFPNLRHIHFYDSSNAGLIVEGAKDLVSLETMGFEVSPVSERSLETLAEYPSLKRVFFEQVMADAVVAELREAMPGVEIHATLASEEAALRRQLNSRDERHFKSTDQ